MAIYHGHYDIRVSPTLAPGETYWYVPTVMDAGMANWFDDSSPTHAHVEVRREKKPIKNEFRSFLDEIDPGMNYYDELQAH